MGSTVQRSRAKAGPQCVTAGIRRRASPCTASTTSRRGRCSRSTHQSSGTSRGACTRCAAGAMTACTSSSAPTGHCSTSRSTTGRSASAGTRSASASYPSTTGSATTAASSPRAVRSGRPRSPPPMQPATPGTRSRASAPHARNPSPTDSSRTGSPRTSGFLSVRPSPSTPATGASSSAIDYDREVAAATDREPRLSCSGTVTQHLDGHKQCTNPDCPGAGVQHRVWTLCGTIRPGTVCERHECWVFAWASITERPPDG